jgi:hypothetical protein
MITTIYSQIKERVKKAWIKYKNVVRRELQLALSRIHISLNIWISLNRFLFLTIITYFITHILKKQKALLTLK